MKAKENTKYAQIINDIVYHIFNSNSLAEWCEDGIDNIDEQGKKIHEYAITTVEIKKKHGVVTEGLCYVRSKDKFIPFADALSDEQKYNIRKQQSQSLIDQHEWRWTNRIKWDRYNKDQQELLIKFYDTLVDVINNKIIDLPEYDIVEELSKLA